MFTFSPPLLAVTALVYTLFSLDSFLNCLCHSYPLHSVIWEASIMSFYILNPEDVTIWLIIRQKSPTALLIKSSVLNSPPSSWGIHPPDLILILWLTPADSLAILLICCFLHLEAPPPTLHFQASSHPPGAILNANSPEGLFLTSPSKLVSHPHPSSLYHFILFFAFIELITMCMCVCVLSRLRPDRQLTCTQPCSGSFCLFCDKKKKKM